MFGEQFKVNPETVPDVVSVQTWQRWKLREQARSARRAIERSQETENWVTELTPAERAAMDWAEQSDEDTD